MSNRQNLPMILSSPTAYLFGHLAPPPLSCELEWQSSFFVFSQFFHSGSDQPRIGTKVLGHSLVRLLAPLTRSLAPDCLLRSRPPLRSLVRSLAHFAHSLARGKVNNWMAILSVFFSIFTHSVVVVVELLFRISSLLFWPLSRKFWRKWNWK